MIRIVAPGADDVAALQEREESYYWSGCAETFLRQYGIVSVSSPGMQPSDPSIDLVLRRSSARGRGDAAAAPRLDHAGFYEGPLANDMLDALGIAATEHTVEVLRLELPHQSKNAALVAASDIESFDVPYHRFDVRRIPGRMGETSDPYPFESQDPLYRDAGVLIQEFTRHDGWRPTLYAREPETGRRLVIGVTDGLRHVYGAPFFDLVCFGLAFPPVEHGYYSSLNSISQPPLRDFLLAQLHTIAAQAGAPLVSVDIWPRGMRSAFTVRHDYDRYITNRELQWLLDRYAERDVKCTWYTLASRAPSAQLRILADAGHEVALHTEACDEPGFRRELEHVRRELGAPVHGMTAHGGLGSPGFIGDTQYRWAEAAGLQYAEMLGRDPALPHRIVHTRHGRPESADLLVPATHCGLESSTQERELDIEAVADICRGHLQRGAQLSLLNHPDIFRPELIRTIDALDREGCWNATHRQIIEWTSISRYESTVESSENSRFVTFARPLPEAAALRLGPPATAKSGAAPRSIPAERGATRVRID